MSDISPEVNHRPLRFSGLTLRTLLAAALCLQLLSACQNTEQHNAQLFVFGTIVELKVRGVTADKADKAFIDIQQMFNQMHRDWHAWEPGRLTAINEAFEKGEAAVADADIIAMIQRSKVIEQQSGGRFNPAIGGLVRLWGFHTSDYPIIGPPPTQAQIDQILEQQPSSLNINVDGLNLRSDNPAVQLDFGGIAKGYAVDLTIERLKQMGIGDAIVNAGGDLRAIGDHGDRPWRVAVRKPGGGNIGAIEVDGDESIFTSGNYERFRQDKKERYPHIINPATGWPSEDISSVTVISNEGLLADAAATALVVAGLDHWPQVAAGMGLDQVAVVDENGTVYLTAEMQKRIEFSADVETVIIDISSTEQTH